MLTSIILLLFPWLVQPLRITRLEVPAYADVRGSVSLSCHFDLGQTSLHSVKWYKNDAEFFRFVPTGQPIKKIFPVNGVRPDIFRSNITNVLLINLTYNTTGLYLCEVSSEAPHFNVASKSANLTILGLPSNPRPDISGVRQVYNLGDKLSANCTASPSKPPANLTWFINDVPAPEWSLEQYESPASLDIWQMQSRTLSISFQLIDRHFEGKVLTLKCTASVAGLVANATSVLVMPAELRSQRGEKQYGNHQTTGRMSSVSLWTLILLSGFFNR